MAKTPASAKKQRSISAFFTPQKPATTKLPSPPQSRPPEESTPIKRKLTEFPHTANGDSTAPPSPKRPRSISSLSSSSSSKAPEKSVPKQSKTKLTPLEKQFVELKRAHPDKILAIQVGYKFKFFGNDAVVASQLLNIMLIRGNLELDERTHDRFAYCSIPDNRLHVHLQRLLNHGMKVGVVKQTETAAIKSVESKSGLFERKITGVYTKATYMGDEMLTGDPAINRSNQVDESGNNNAYIIAIHEGDARNTAIVAVQPFTGDIIYDVFTDNNTKDELETRLAYLMPSEVILIHAASSVNHETQKIVKIRNPSALIQYRVQKKQSEVSAGLEQFFKATKSSAHLSEYYQLNYNAAVCQCVNELISYLEEFQLSNVFTIPSNISSFTDTRKYMLLPANTLRALDIFEVEDNPSSRTGTLAWLLNRTKTKNGARLLHKWIYRPLVEKHDIEERLEAVDTLRKGNYVHMIDVLKSTLSKVGKENVDLDRSLIKVHYSAEYKNDKIARKDVYLVLRGFSDILEVFSKFGGKGLAEFKACSSSSYLQDLFEEMFKLSQESVVEDLLRQVNSAAAMDENNVSDQKIKFFNLNDEKFDNILHEQEQIAMVESALDQELASIRAYLKRPQLKFVTNLKDTHLIEVRNGKNVDALPPDWIKISGTKSVSRFRTPEVAKLHKELSYHNEMLQRACDESFNSFLKEIDSHYEYLHSVVSKVSIFDCLLSLAEVGADDQTYTKPNLVEKQVIDIEDGYHPILYAMAQESVYVPNDVTLARNGNRVLIITGPNMGGKSSYVKQVALMVIMTQIGAFIPCKSATLGVFDSVYIRMGASDNILRGKSTFMVEMIESANIINSFTSKSLVILDEIGRGTGTSDGIALAYSILRYIIESDEKPVTLFITHYPSLHVLEREYDNVKNYHMAFVETNRGPDHQNEWPEVVFLYKLVQGVVSNSYGLNVAKLAGIPLDVIKRAHEMSEAMKRDVELKNWINVLYNTNGHAAEALSSLVHSI
ncbi:hypothetical protein FDK38_004644 [Candidozyma auris]|nr:hypothetical protein FDK38_004644 [[Candida] auris]